MKKKISMFYLCLITMLSSASAFEKVDIKLDKKILEAGKTQYCVSELQTEDGKNIRGRGASVILIDAPPDEVWKYICDYNSMKEYVPHVDRFETVKWIKPISRGDVGESLMKLMTDYPMLRSRWTIRITFDEPQKYQHWSLIKKEEAKKLIGEGINVIPPSFGVKEIVGFQYLEPYEGGDKTLLYYTSFIESYIPVPGFIERFITEAALNDFLVSVKKRVESKGAYKKY